MKTEYKYIRFTWVMDKPKTSVWHCRNKRNEGILGTIEWYGPWRQYCFFPVSTTVFNVSCLSDINDFIRQLKVGSPVVGKKG